MSYGIKQALGKKSKKLIVDEIFYSIQTEGPFAGRPATFIRLWGCNLKCSFCDTDQKEGEAMTVQDILAEVMKNDRSNFVVITGGEPFRQNIAPLVKRLSIRKRVTQIETNGTLTNPDFPWEDTSVYIVCSPKEATVCMDIADHTFAWKYLVSKGNTDEDGLPLGVYKATDKKRIMISPMFDDGMNKTRANMEEAVKICKYFGYYLSLQTHKWLNIK